MNVKSSGSLEREVPFEGVAWRSPGPVPAGLGDPGMQGPVPALAAGREHRRLGGRRRGAVQVGMHLP